MSSFETISEGIRIAHGDCLEVMREIPDGSVDMVLTDMPYGCTKAEWDIEINLEKFWNEIIRVTKRNAAILLFASGWFTAELMVSNPGMWRYNLVWVKTTPTGFLNANRMPLRAHEDICVFYRKLPAYKPQKTFGHTRKTTTRRTSSVLYGNQGRNHYDSTERFPTSILEYATDKQVSSLHPTQKPVALCVNQVLTYTDEGQTVLDATMGSGTTGIACHRTSRAFIGIEKGELEYLSAKDRLTAECAQGRFALWN